MDIQKGIKQIKWRGDERNNEPTDFSIYRLTPNRNTA